MEPSLELLDAPSVRAGISFQPSHSLFEESLCVRSCPLLDCGAGTAYVNGGGAAAGAAMSAKFRRHHHRAARH